MMSSLLSLEVSLYADHNATTPSFISHISFKCMDTSFFRQWIYGVGIIPAKYSIISLVKNTN